MGDPLSKWRFTHKNRVVEIGGLDEGTTSCVAQVVDDDDAFSIWADPAHPVKLQFSFLDLDFWGAGSAVSINALIESMACRDRKTPTTR